MFKASDALASTNSYNERIVRAYVDKICKDIESYSSQNETKFMFFNAEFSFIDRVVEILRNEGEYTVTFWNHDDKIKVSWDPKDKLSTKEKTVNPNQIPNITAKEALNMTNAYIETQSAEIEKAAREQVENISKIIKEQAPNSERKFVFYNASCLDPVIVNKMMEILRDEGNFTVSLVGSQMEISWDLNSKSSHSTEIVDYDDTDWDAEVRMY